MKVALVNQPTEAYTLPYPSSSIALWMHEISHVLARSCDVVIYAKPSKGWPTMSRNEGVEIRWLSTNADIPLRRVLRWTSSLRDRRKPGLASIFYHLAYGYALARDLRRQRCDVVHLANFTQWIPLIRRTNPNIGIVLHMHCNWLTQIDRGVLEPRLEQADLILGCSEHIAQRIRERFPRIAHKCDSIYNGVGRSFFVDRDAAGSSQGTAKKLLFVGRVSPEKGVHVLVEAFNEVAAGHPNVSLDIVGPKVPMLREFYCDLADEQERKILAPYYERDYFAWVSGLPSPHARDRIRFVGGIPHQHLHEAYRGADLCVMPSSCEEGFGMPAAEAMASGLAVIGTRTGGIPEVIEDGRSGILVAKDDPAALGAAICRLVEDDELRRSMGRAGRIRCAREFSWDSLGQKLLGKYKTFCGQTPPPAERLERDMKEILTS
jgi:glycosyltransferase involved in cell wall biosynthesis